MRKFVSYNTTNACSWWYRGEWIKSWQLLKSNPGSLAWAASDLPLYLWSCQRLANLASTAARHMGLLNVRPILSWSAKKKNKTLLKGLKAWGNLGHNNKSILSQAFFSTQTMHMHQQYLKLICEHCTINSCWSCICFCSYVQTSGLVSQARPFLFRSVNRFQYSYSIRSALSQKWKKTGLRV